MSEEESREVIGEDESNSAIAEEESGRNVSKEVQVEEKTPGSNEEKGLSGESKVLLSAEVLSEIKSLVPVDMDETMVSKVYMHLQKLSENIEDKKTLNEMEQYIDSRLDDITEIIEDYNQKEVPPDVEEIHTKLLDGFVMIYEGLFGIKEFIFHEDSQLVVKAFEMLSDGDKILMEVDEDLQQSIKDNPVTVIL